MFLAGVTVGLAFTAPAGAQVRVVDEGTFSIYAAGERIGREDFSIRAVPGAGGGTYIAQANVLMGTRLVSVALSADSSGAPVRYSLETSIDGRVVETITGESRRGVWFGRARRDGGESAREFRLPPGSVAAEPGVVHQLWFLLRRAAGKTPGLLLPRTLTMAEVVLEHAGDDTVMLGLQEIAAQRWLVRSPGDAYAAREAWTDAEGRLLRVRVPTMDLDAVRDEPPNETRSGRAPYDAPEPF